MIPRPIRWACGVVPGHEHATEADAADCIRRHTVSAPYGYCPRCDARGYIRGRRPDGADVCERGHAYPPDQAR